MRRVNPSRIGVGKSGCARLPSLRTVHAVLSHTALQLVVAQWQGLHVPGMGISQTSKSQISEVSIRLAGCSRQMLGIATATLKQCPYRRPLRKDRNRTIVQVVEVVPGVDAHQLVHRGKDVAGRTGVADRQRAAANPSEPGPMSAQVRPHCTSNGTAFEVVSFSERLNRCVLE